MYALPACLCMCMQIVAAAHEYCFLRARQARLSSKNAWHVRGMLIYEPMIGCACFAFIHSRSKKRNMGGAAAFGGGADGVVRPAVDPAQQLALQTHIQQIVAALQMPNADTQQQAATACRMVLSDSADPPIQMVIASGALPVLAHLLTADGFPVIQTEVAWALSTIASGNSAQTQEVVPALPSLMRLLDSPHSSIQEHVLLAIGNIAGNGPAARDAVLAQGGMEKVLRIVQTEFRLSLLRRWVLKNTRTHAHTHTLPSRMTMASHTHHRAAVSVLC